MLKRSLKLKPRTLLAASAAFALALSALPVPTSAAEIDKIHFLIPGGAGGGGGGGTVPRAAPERP